MRVEIFFFRMAFLFLAVEQRLLGGDWPGWRGPRGDGVSQEPEVPASWGRRENIAWRVEPPGLGHSSPIVWGDALFLTTAVMEGDQARRILIRYGTLSGDVLWQREVLRAVPEEKHQKNSYASGTPVTDGQRVYTAFFQSGRVQVTAVGFSGEIQWQVSPCGFQSIQGISISPVLHGELLIVNCDQDSEEAAIFALERSTGGVRWRTKRPNYLRSYVTPLIAHLAGRPQLLLSGSKVAASYDPADGRTIWSCDGPTDQCVASPVVGHGLVFITGGYPGREILAIRPDGQGDVSATHVAWRSSKGVAYVPSPLLWGDHLYLVQDETGVVSCFEARSGNLVWQERLGGSFSSSLAYAAGNIYAASEDGVVHVFKAGPRFERVARIEMGEGIFASPAFSGGRIYLRTTQALYAIGPPGKAQAGKGSFAGTSNKLLQVFDPPRLPADARLGKRRDLNGYHPWNPITGPEAWQSRARRVREQVLVAAGLWPLPEPAPLDPVFHGAIDRGDYTIEKVFFRSYPNFYVTGNLYRPKGGAGRRPAVLSPHGHWKNGRFYENGEKEAREQIEAGKEKTLEGARYPLQARCAQLARLGCVVFHYDMVGYADSTQINHAAGFRDAEAELRLQSALGLQTYNSIRALDFLAGLPDVDRERIGVTGASGGGTQTFILCAVDDRPAAAFPAVMVSTSMQGGCVCENASHLRVGTGNIELAALCAPRPLGMTGANDWTLEIETKGFPELKALYTALGVPDRVSAKCFPQFEHNYNQVSRELMYSFMNRHLRLGHPEPIQERPFEPVPPADLKVFDESHPRPADALDAARLRRSLTEASEKQLEALRPRDAASLAEFQRVVGTALRVMVGSDLPDPREVAAEKLGEARGSAGGVPFVLEKLILARRGGGEAVPAVLLNPEKRSGTVVVAVHPEGKAGAIAGGGGEVAPLCAKLLSRGAMVLGLDPFLTGEYHLLEKRTAPPEVNSNYAGYTFGYNRSLLAERVHDILTAVAYARGRGPDVRLLGLDRAGTWTLLARALAGKAVERALVDLGRFRFEDVQETSHEMMLPGALKYGGIPAFAALAAPGHLWAVDPPERMELLQEAYQAAGHAERLRLEPEPPADGLVDWLLR